MSEVRDERNYPNNSILIENTITGSLLHNGDAQFRVNIENKLDDYLADLEKVNYLNLKKCNGTDIRRLCLNHVEKIFEKYSSERQSVYKGIPCRCKDSKYISCGILFYILELYYDMDNSKVPHGKYRQIFRDTIHSSFFSTTLKFLREEIIEIDSQLYHEKTIAYSKKYIEILKNYYNLEISEDALIETIKNSIDYLTKNKILCRKTSITKESQRTNRLKQILEENGLTINAIFKENFYPYFLPQYLATLLVYTALIRKIDKETIEISSLKTICNHFNLSNYKASAIKDYLVNAIEECSENPLPRFRYTNDSFKKKLNSVCKNTSRTEIKMVINLFKILRIDYKEFVANVISFNFKRDAGAVISRLKVHDFSYMHYKGIQRNIKKLMKLKKISKEQYESAKTLIEDVITDKLKLYNPTTDRNIRSKTLKHNSLFYRFKFVEGNIYRIKDTIIKKKIQKFVGKVMNNKYPLELFNSQGIRCSDFYIEGTRKERITINTIKTHLINPLLKKNRLSDNCQIIDELHGITEKVIKQYKTTNHEPVLTHLLMEMKQLNMISVETPVWYKEITGHIDLLGELDDTLFVIEYKPKEAELYKGMIQTCIYAFILSKVLKISIEKIKCLIFSPKIALTFDLTILNEIIEFIQIQNSKREEYLTLKNNKPYDIEKELFNLLKK